MPRKKNEAVNPSNQHLVDTLIEVSDKPYYANNSNYNVMFKRALISLMSHPEPVTSRDEVKKLKGIGDFCATRLFPIGTLTKNQNKTNNKKRKQVDNNSFKAKSSDDELISDHTSSGHIITSSNACKNEGNTINNISAQPLSPIIPTHEEAEKLLKKLKANVVSDKHSSFLRATQFGEEMAVEDYVNWKVILLIDKRERNCDDVQSKLIQCGM